jgi:quercetin dioxygenase-like cupin family protein
MSEPVFVDEAERGWETWPDDLVDERGHVFWKTLVGGEGLTLGIARLAPGEELRRHRHAHAEVYLVSTGAGVVTVDGERRDVGPGSAVFIPGNAEHSCANTGAAELRFAYVLAADAFAEVEYVFLDSS